MKFPIKTTILTRLEKGSGLIYDLHIAGHRCTNLYKKFSCDICECQDKPLCKACKKFIELERLYYITQIIIILKKYIKKLEQIPEWKIYQKKVMIQTKLF